MAYFIDVNNAQVQAGAIIAAAVLAVRRVKATPKTVADFVREILEELHKNQGQAPPRK